MRSTKSRCTAALLLVAALLLTACGAKSSAPSGGQTAPGKKNVLNVGLFGEPDFIDPHVATSVGFVPIDNAYESLVYMKRDTTEMAPQLAESWTPSADGLTWTFKIRKNVKFQDGTALDANAVKASFDRVAKLKKGPSWVLDFVESITIPDPDTIVFKIKPGGPPFLESLWLIRIVSPKAISEHDKNGDLAQDWFNRQSDGTGPYRIVSWEHGQKVVLEKFADYWGGWPGSGHFDTVNMLTIPESNTQRLMLEKGDLDMAMKFPAEALPDLGKNPDIQVIKAEGVRTLTLRLQNAAPPTSDPRVRQAVNYAFDFTAFNKAMEGTYDDPVGPVPASYLGNWKPNYPYHYDVTRAKALLNDAGYNESHKAVLIADILSGDADQKKAAEILQAGLRATGAADVDIRIQEWPVMLKYNVDWQKSKDPKTAHHLFGLFTPPRVPDPYAYLWYLYDAKATGAFARNVMNYSNPKVDQLLDQAANTKDAKARLDLYRQADQQTVDDAADLWVGVQTKVYLLRKDIKGFFPHPIWYPDVQAWYLTRG